MHTVMQLSTTFVKQLRRLAAIALIAMMCLGTLSLTPSAAQAATIEILVGSQQGKFAFEPSRVTIQPGDTIEWVNNLATDSACNVVFDKVGFTSYPAADENPETDQELFDYLSHQPLMKTPKETVKKIFNVPEGEYAYVCTPHQGNGMVGKVIVAKG
jgi:plastocyanin